MENLNLLISKNIFVLVACLSLIIILLAAYIFSLKSSLNKLQRKYDFFMQQSGEVNIDTVLTRNMENIAQAQQELEDLKEKHARLQKQVKGCIQTVKLKRYDAFDAMGGEMSYSLLLADEEKNGIILTSIYGREESRSYAKDIKGGKSSYVLAEEEQDLL